jgi:hypothetical protein
MKWAQHKACMGEKRNAFTVLIGKPESSKLAGVSQFVVHRKVQDHEVTLILL